MATRAQVREAQQLLRKIGWPITVDGSLGPKTSEAVEDFKRGFNLYGHKGDNIRPFQAIDGRVGPVTLDRMRWSAGHNGRCSRHFTYRECRSKGNGWIKVRREFLKGMEKYRAKVGHPVGFASVYRDPAHNAAVGGASQSQHLYGAAGDLTPELTVAQVRALGCFSGIGYQRSSGRVRHADVRHVSGHNGTGGTPNNPTIWEYPG